MLLFLDKDGQFTVQKKMAAVYFTRIAFGHSIENRSIPSRKLIQNLPLRHVVRCAGSKTLQFWNR